MKLLLLLRSLQSAEYRDFEKFLQSPYFKESPQYLRFFQYLLKRHPDFDLDAGGMRTACSHCFKLSALTDPQWHNLTSGMSRQIELFLVMQQATGSAADETDWFHYLLVRSLKMRNTGDYFFKQSLQLIQNCSKDSILKTEDYLLTHQLHNLIYYNADTPKTEEYVEHLHQSVHQLDQYFCINVLRDAAEMRARARILDTPHQQPALLNAVLDYCRANVASPENTLLLVYYLVVELYQSELEESGFRRMMQVFDAHFHSLPATDRILLLRHLINIGIALISRGYSVEPELLSLYQRAIDAGMLMENNRITANTFINIANLASLCKAFDWAFQFIETYAVFLEPSQKNPTVQLAKAGVYYNQGKLNMAQDCLIQELFTMPFFDMLSRGLLLKIIFDRYLLDGTDYEFLRNQLNTFQKYIPGRTITNEKKQAQLNWIKMVRTLSKAKFQLVTLTSEKKELFRKQLHAHKFMVYQKWVEDKIDAL